MVSDKENRYLYKCSCEQLRKRPLILQILTIMKQSEKKYLTKGEINKIGQQKHQNWPKDPNTIYRALKTMHECKLINQDKKRQGKSTLWSLNKKQISDRDLMIHEIKQLEHVVSNLPQGMFEYEYYKKEIDTIWQNIRNALVVLQSQDITVYWMLFQEEEKKLLTSKIFPLLDRQLSIIFLFCLYCPKGELIDTWFDRSQIPYHVKADFDLRDIFIRNFYPDNTKEKMFEILDKHRLNPTLSKKLYIIILRHLRILKIQSEYESKLFDKNKFNILDDGNLEEFEETISHEKLKIFKERLRSESYLLELFEKKEYPLDKIDMFIEKYKKILPSTK